MKPKMAGLHLGSVTFVTDWVGRGEYPLPYLAL
jgi:hypothetical protein